MKKIELVYIIEDDPIATYIIKSVIENNTDVEKSLTFENGLLDLNMLANSFKNELKLPDLILLDINMPIMDAWDFLDAVTLLENYKPLKIFILSSSVNPEDMEKSKQYSDVRGFMPKPFDDSKLNLMF